MKIFNSEQARNSIAEILNTVTSDEPEPCYIFSCKRKAVVISLDEYERLKDSDNEHRALIHKSSIER